MSVSLSRRSLLAITAAAAGGRLAGQRRTPPNILVIMADQHSPHVLGCYGDTVIRTPNLDALARRGTLFRNAYCQAPLCVPSRMSFLTSRQPSENGVWMNSDTLASDMPTFAHSLGAAGYECALIGRMHFNGPDQRHGFTKRLVGDLTPAYPDVPIPLPPSIRPGATNSSLASVTIAGPGSTAYRVFDEDVTKSAVEYIHATARSDKPFCAVAGFVLPHSPFICSEEDWNYYYDRVSIPHVPAGYLEGLHPAVKAWRKARGVETVNAEQVRRARAGYYGLVAELDRHVGKILAALHESGQEENTLVVYTSDHGEMAGENGMWWKFNFFQGSVMVPLIVALPGRIPGGRSIPEVVSLIDVAPTLTEVAGSERLPRATGRSLMPLLTGTGANWPDEAFSELPAIGPVPATRMVRRGRWKLVHFDGMRPQLFDIQADPHEFHDLGEDPAHRTIREELDARAAANWSAAAINAELEARRKDELLVRLWAQKVHPPDSQLWTAPAGANQFRKE